MLAGLALLFVASSPGSTADHASTREKLIVLDLATTGGVDRDVAAALTEAITTEASARGYFEVVSSKALQTLVSVERQRQMVGCSEQSCLTEIAGAYGARFVLGGAVARLGDVYQLSLQTVDSRKATVMARSTRLAKDPGALRALVPFAVAEATGTPLPPPPSHVLAYSILGAGLAGLVAGGVVGFDALARDRTLSHELAVGSTTPPLPTTRSDYQQQIAQIGGERTVALVAGVAGAALAVVGLLINPGDVPAAGSARARLVPTERGVAIAGEWP